MLYSAIYAPLASRRMARCWRIQQWRGRRGEHVFGENMIWPLLRHVIGRSASTNRNELESRRYLSHSWHSWGVVKQLLEKRNDYSGIKVESENSTRPSTRGPCTGSWRKTEPRMAALYLLAGDEMAAMVEQA